MEYITILSALPYLGFAILLYMVGQCYITCQELQAETKALQGKVSSLLTALRESHAAIIACLERRKKPEQFQKQDVK